MLYRPKPKSSVLLDLSPLIDVVFLLLIFFMVSTTFKDDHGLDLSLPGSESRQSAKSEHLTIVIDKDMVIRVDEENVAKEALQQKIQQLLSDHESKMVVLKVDRSVSHGLVVEAMDAAKSAGAEGLTFATVAKKAELPER